ncbi:MAG: class I SAM-dependent methyltransferase [Chloroflexi bacterium]|nr:class I SAM-dependent methyltransferase [Chloroflexota bacterium]
MNSKQPENNEPFFRSHCVCPWWLCFTFDNVLRRLLQNPERILKPYIEPGWTVLDVGPGMGYFTITLAKLVGDSGKVIAADLQKKMLDGVYQRALKADVQDRIKLHLSTPDKIFISEPIDFCLAFWMVHEVSDRAHFIGEIASALKQNGLLLLVEPRLHVSKKNFNETLKIAKSAGLSVVSQPAIFMSNSALLRK